MKDSKSVNFNNPLITAEHLKARRLSMSDKARKKMPAAALSVKTKFNWHEPTAGPTT